MDELVEWLRAQLDEDERIARDALRRATTTRRWIGGAWVEDVVQPPEWRRSVWDPARVLREIDAKRRMLVRCQEAMLAANPMPVHFAKQTVREMALPYSDRPGYEAALATFE
jgi:hypothetical protein